ncbi:MAG: hypothetical protein KAS62_03990 [Candidatus Delongbacteria bacterium]|nr:hypothetical protein [Candidatus Delongbacteria bacterium]
MKKKMLSVLLGTLLIAGVSFAALTDFGQIAANIPLTTAITVAAYPTNIATGTPAAISDGTGVAAEIVVNGVAITDNSINGWTLDVVSTNGSVLINQTDLTTTIAYTLEMSATTGGVLGAGLGIVAGSPLALGAGAIATAGVATTASVAYAFDLTMDITNAATIGKLAGDYADTITLTVASND